MTFTKLRLISDFNKAASTYDAAASLQQEVGNHLLEFVINLAYKPKTILDLGCGTGYFLEKITQYYAEANIFGIDIADQMVKQCQKKHLNNVTLVCADADLLPLADNTCDIIFSNLMLQWSHNISETFCEIKRILAPGGKFFFTTFGPKSLHELNQAWLAVDNQSHVLGFHSLTNLGRHYPYDTILKSQIIRRYYHNPLSLMHELKMLGAQNKTYRLQQGLLGKEKFSRMMQKYERFRTEQGIPATFEIIYGVIEKW